MEFNHDKLAGRIKEKFGSQAALAEFLGWPASKLSNRIHNKVHLNADDIWTLCAPNCLDIEGHEVVLYFFTPRFAKVEPTRRRG